MITRAGTPMPPDPNALATRPASRSDDDSRDTATGATRRQTLPGEGIASDRASADIQRRASQRAVPTDAENYPVCFPVSGSGSSTPPRGSRQSTGANAIRTAAIQPCVFATASKPESVPARPQRPTGR